jgi:hypothetical protein
MIYHVETASSLNCGKAMTKMAKLGNASATLLPVPGQKNKARWKHSGRGLLQRIGAGSSRAYVSEL